MTAALFSDPMLAALEADTVNSALAVEILYPMGPVRLNSGPGELLLNGHAYKGTGALGGIDPVTQTSRTEPARLGLSLSGLDPLLLSEVMNTKCQGSPVKVWFVVLSTDLATVVGASLLFTGKLSTQRLKIGKQATISVEAVDRLSDWSRAGTERFSDESHRSRHPSDRFFRYVAQMSEKVIYWGSEKTGPGFRYDN